MKPKENPLWRLNRNFLETQYTNIHVLLPLQYNVNPAKKGPKCRTVIKSFS